MKDSVIKKYLPQIESYQNDARLAHTTQALDGKFDLAMFEWRMNTDGLLFQPSVCNRRSDNNSIVINLD